MENAELSQVAARTIRQLADLSGEHHQLELNLEQQLEKLQAAAAAAAAAALEPAVAEIEAEVAPLAAAVVELGATVVALQDHLAGLDAAVQDLPAREEMSQVEERGLGATAAALQDCAAIRWPAVRDRSSSARCLGRVSLQKPGAWAAGEVESAAKGAEDVYGAAATSSAPAEGDEEAPPPGLLGDFMGLPLDLCLSTTLPLPY